MQVMALVAHLMEEKNNFGPHLIVVPNAVLVNWRSELHAWLPGAPSLLPVSAAPPSCSSQIQEYSTVTTRAPPRTVCSSGAGAVVLSMGGCPTVLPAEAVHGVWGPWSDL